MTTLYPCHLFSASTKHRNSIPGFKNGLAQCNKIHGFSHCVKPFHLVRSSRYNISCAMNMAAGQSDDPGKMKFDHLIAKARKLWESSPQPVKIFPWKRAGLNFIQVILDLVLAVVKYLCVPLLAVSSLSEMSYCAQERKLFFVPVPVIIGMVIAEVLKLAALDASPDLKSLYMLLHFLLQE